MTGITTPVFLTYIAPLHLMVLSQISLAEDEQKQDSRVID